MGLFISVNFSTTERMDKDHLNSIKSIMLEILRMVRCRETDFGVTETVISILDNGEQTKLMVLVFTLQKLVIIKVEMCLI